MASAKPKPATNGLGSVEVDGLQRWGEVAPTAMEADPSEALLLDDMATSPFVMNEELNFRIALWQGDVTTLKVDAVVNCNNDDLNERSGVSGQLFVAAGPQLEEACTRLGGCQPGQAKATRGFKLPAKHVIHTVPPPWLDGREAEATLERCYESSLRAAAQLQCATVAVTCIKTKDAPREQVAHAALRTVRRLLEQPSTRGLQLVLFAMRPQDVYDAMVYENLLPLYFPRSSHEEHEAARLLPALAQPAAAAPRRTGGPPGGAPPPQALLTAQPTLGRQPSAALAGLTQPPRMAPRPGSPSRLGGSVGDRGAAHAASAATTAAVASVAGADEAMRRGSAYASFLERAGLADLSDIDAMELFYRAGVDARGRPIFLFWAGHLPARPIDRERVLMHIMRTLDRYVQSAYIIVYIHTTLSPENEPPFAWLRKVYELFDRRLKDNLYLMYIVHASWWLKMAMNFLRTFAGNGRFWETKVIQLPCLADLFKRNYFAPGTLRMPDSPLVRKYLEMSNDVHLLDAVMGDDAATRHAKADALAAAVSAGALPGGRLGPGASPTEQAAVALAAAERASTDGHGGAAGGAGSNASQKLAQAQASKEILLKQLIEISDQLAYSRAASDAVEQRLGSVQAAKDQEINRLSNALFEAHRDVDEARRKLEQVHQHTVTMEDEKSERRDALAELADLEGQLAHAQVYNHYMAKELLNLQKTIKADRWEMLYEISSLERQLEAAKARRTLEHAHPPKNGHSSSLANGHAGTHAAEGEEEAEAVLRDELGLPIVSTEASRLEELAQLQATLAAQRTEVARAMEAMAREQIELGAALKQAAEEAASTRGAEQARAAQAEKRQHELQAATKELEEKISAIKAAAKLGAERAVEQSSVAELSALEAIVLAAEEDIGRIEQRLAEPAGDGLTDLELLELQASLKRRKEALEGEARLEPALARIASRKDAAMAEVASQLVPHMNTLQRAHEEQRATAEARLQLPTISDAERSALVGLLNQQAAAHEAELADLEARAAQALASLEDRFEQEAERASAEAKAAALEKMRVEARLDGVNARLAGIAAGGALSKVSAPARAGSQPAGSFHQRAATGGGNTAGSFHRATAGTGFFAGVKTAAWVQERLAFFFEESAGMSSRRALVRWARTAAYLAGVAAAGGGDLSHAAWAQVRADKVALMRRIDEQQSMLESSSRAPATAPALHAASGAAPPPRLSLTDGGAIDQATAHQVASAVAGWRRELGAARGRVRALEQENERLLYQLEVARDGARDGAERLASLPPGAVQSGEGAARYAESLHALHALHAELSRAHDDAMKRRQGGAHHDATRGGQAVAEELSEVTAEVTAAEAEALSAQYAELSEGLAAQRQQLLRAQQRAAAAEEEHARATGQRGEPRADPSRIIAAQRAVDEASDALADAEVAVEQRRAKLGALEPHLHAVRRERAKGALRAIDEARLEPAELDLAEAQAVIELLLQQRGAT